MKETSKVSLLCEKWIGKGKEKKGAIDQKAIVNQASGGRWEAWMIQDTFCAGSGGESSIENFTGNFCFEQLGAMDGGVIYQDGEDQEKGEKEETESSKLHIVGFWDFHEPSKWINRFRNRQQISGI